MAICATLAVAFGIASFISPARPGLIAIPWKKVAICSLLAIFILYSLGQIDLAGVKATGLREPNKWNHDFRDGVLMTMSGVSPNTLRISFALVLLLQAALFPIKSEKADSKR